MSLCSVLLVEWFFLSFELNLCGVLSLCCVLLCECLFLNRVFVVLVQLVARISVCCYNCDDVCLFQSDAFLL